MQNRRGALGRALLILALGLPVAVLGPAATEAAPPAAIDPGEGGGHAHRSFRRFADGWMKSLATAEKRLSAERRGSDDRRQRRYGSEYQLELRPTGQSRVPFVGILRYVEERWRCPDARGIRCKLSKRTPVSEVFRYQDGRWVY